MFVFFLLRKLWFLFLAAYAVLMAYVLIIEEGQWMFLGIFFNDEDLFKWALFFIVLTAIGEFVFQKIFPFAKTPSVDRVERILRK